MISADCLSGRVLLVSLRPSEVALWRLTQVPTLIPLSAVVSRLFARLLLLLLRVPFGVLRLSNKHFPPGLCRDFRLAETFTFSCESQGFFLFPA